MGSIALLKGSYQSRSVIADAQACINLYPETNPGDREKPITLYPTPGLTLLKAPPISAPTRCNYRATNGDFYRVIGANVYYVNSSWAHTFVGTLGSSVGICYMYDNTLAIVVVDGTGVGYAIDMNTRAFGRITSPAFYGSPNVKATDTYFVFSRPGTNQWYISLSNASYTMLTGVYGGILTGTITNAGTSGTDGMYTSVALTGGHGTGAIATITITGGIATAVTITTPGTNYALYDVLGSAVAGLTGFAYTVQSGSGIAFDPLAIATKSGNGDPVVTFACMRNEVWLIGQTTTEVWYDSGNADFAFSKLPGAFIEHGCAAATSIAQHDQMLFWVALDPEGSRIIVSGMNYQVEKISTYAIDNELQTYSTVSDAIGYVYQQGGHINYVVTFPSANKTWSYDTNEKQWHQKAYTDNNGVFNRHLGQCGVYVYGTNVVGDYINGNLYKFDLNNYTDNGQPITRLKAFPHVMKDMKRVTHSSFIANVDCGNDTGAVDGSSSLAPPQIYLSWSDDRGHTFGNRVGQSLGDIGNFINNPKWNRLGIARDRVYRLDWSDATLTALQGAFLETRTAGS